MWRLGKRRRRGQTLEVGPEAGSRPDPEGFSFSGSIRILKGVGPDLGSGSMVQFHVDIMTNSDRWDLTTRLNVGTRGPIRGSGPSL